ncbi:MAG TPA: LEA type 2 family protein [Cyclobacteriaceae bacterium]|nr:LEA type 2 family protein [Cyclobacteriaceae bacterium]
MRKSIFYFCGLLFLISCYGIDVPEFKAITEFTATSDGSNVILKGDGIFYNPNKKKLYLKNADICVFLNGEPVATIKEKFYLDIPPEQEFTVPLSINIDPDLVKELVKNNALSLLAGKGLSLKYKGKIRVKSSGLPVTVPVNEEISINLNDLL